MDSLKNKHSTALISTVYMCCGLVTYVYNLHLTKMHKLRCWKKCLILYPGLILHDLKSHGCKYVHNVDNVKLLVYSLNTIKFMLQANVSV